MKANELKKLSADKLKDKLKDLVQEQFKLRMKKATGEFKQTHLLKQVRRDIARVKTTMTQKGGDQ